MEKSYFWLSGKKTVSIFLSNLTGKLLLFFLLDFKFPKFYLKYLVSRIGFDWIFFYVDKLDDLDDIEMAEELDCSSWKISLNLILICSVGM